MLLLQFGPLDMLLLCPVAVLHPMPSRQSTHLYLGCCGRHVGEGEGSLEELVACFPV